jgi:hypothetical protein
MMVRFKEIAEGRSRRTRPISFFHILPGENNHLTKLPKENLDFEGNLSFPYPFIVITC